MVNRTATALLIRVESVQIELHVRVTQQQAFETSRSETIQNEFPNELLQPDTLPVTSSCAHWCDAARLPVA